MHPSSVALLQDPGFFDDGAVNVLVSNLDCLHTEQQARQQRQQDLQDTSEGRKMMTRFHFDALSPSEEERKNGEFTGVIRVDLKRVLAESMRQGCATEGALPSDLCYFKRIDLVKCSNTLPCDVELRCSKNGRSYGTYYRTGDTVTADDSLCCLCTAHSGLGPANQVHGALAVHKANAFCESKNWQDYLPALRQDIGKCVNVADVHNAKFRDYVSPMPLDSNGHYLRSDWIMTIMGRNPNAFTEPVRSNLVQTQDADGRTRNTVTLRMSYDDWKSLEQAANADVVNPLNAEIIDLVNHPTIEFELVPTNTPDPAASTRDRWKDLVSRPGRVVFTLDVEVQFVDMETIGTEQEDLEEE
jgi:hypothetical protein